MGSAKVRTLIIIPAHNEAENLSHVLTEVLALKLDAHVLVVDDYSSDDTARVAVEAGARVQRLPCNLGYGGAVQAGFRYAIHYGYEFGVLMDADGQHAASSVADLLCMVRDGNADVALGSRFLGCMDYRTTFAKRTGMALFSQLVSRITGHRITDPTSGFQAMKHEVMVFLARDNYPVDFPDADTILLLHFAGFQVEEVPVVMRERLSGESMHSSWKPLYYIAKMFLSILIVLLRQQTHRNAMRPSRQTPPNLCSEPAAQLEGENTSHA